MPFAVRRDSQQLSLGAFVRSSLAAADPTWGSIRREYADALRHA